MADIIPLTESNFAPIQFHKMSPSNFIFTIIFLSTIVIDVNIIGTDGQENGSDEGNLNGTNTPEKLDADADNLGMKCDEDMKSTLENKDLYEKCRAKAIYEKCQAIGNNVEQFLNETVEAKNDGKFWFLWYWAKTALFSNKVDEYKESVADFQKICKQWQDILNEGAKNGSGNGNAELANAKKENAEMKKENAEMKKENAELKKENADLTDGMTKMNVEIAKMNEEMKNEFIKKQKEIDELKAKNEQFIKLMEEEDKKFKQLIPGGNSSESGELVIE